MRGGWLVGWLMCYRWVVGSIGVVRVSIGVVGVAIVVFRMLVFLSLQLCGLLLLIW